MRVIEINSGNFGSTGNIMLQIAEAARTKGHTVITCCPKSRSNQKKKVGNQLFIGNRLTRNLHLRLTYLTGFNGCFSFVSTLRYLRKVSKFSPDVIHLHNLHNCYINLPLLFRFIKKNKIPVVWTLHDCWAFTGQCPHFTMVKCEKWKKGCGDCQSYHEYPGSLVDRTKIMWSLKKKWFTGVENLTIVTPSQWLADLVKQSYLSDYPVKVIYNGIDLSVFKPTESDFRETHGLQNKRLVLGVAFGWGDRKGYGDCLKLAELLDETYQLILVGVTKEQMASLPKNILGIEQTSSQKELAAIYSASDVFINTTYEDNYPTVNLEARACGLPVISYKTGGSPESAGGDAIIVDVGDIVGLKNAIEMSIQRKKENNICNKNSNITSTDREMADMKILAPEVESLSSYSKFMEYTDIYTSINLGGVYALREKYGCIGKCVLLGVAFSWGKRKGLDVFVEIAKSLDDNYQIILVGTDALIEQKLPKSIITIHRTQNQEELAALYSMADLFVNPTREEVLGMVNVEALACGTPVVTFKTGGCPEIVDDTCGCIVKTNDTETLIREIKNTVEKHRFSKDACVKRAQYFRQKSLYDQYLRLYEKVVKENEEQSH